MIVNIRFLSLSKPCKNKNNDIKIYVIYLSTRQREVDEILADKKFQHVLGRQKADRIAVIDLAEKATFERSSEIINHFTHRILEIIILSVKYCRKRGEACG